MFTSIVVALDLEATGDRALPLVGSLADLGGLPVELVTVSSPGMPPDVDVHELAQRAAAYGFAEYRCVVLHDDNPGAALVDHMRSQPDALLVMGTTAKGPLAGPLLGSVSEHVLGHIDSPVLVVGPRAATGRSLASPTLIACLGDSYGIDDAAPVIGSWLRTFGGGRPWIAHALSTEGRAGELGEKHAAERVRRLAEGLSVTDGIDAVGKVLHGDPETVLDEFAEVVDDAVFVAVSSRWTDAHIHRRSVTRRLVQRSTRPVLVVPAERATADKEPLPRLSA